MKEDRISVLAERVLSRLRLPRVGLLCGDAADVLSLPRPARFDWVCYPRSRGGAGPRVYPLPDLPRPEEEGASLTLLVVLEPSPCLVGELLEGLPRSPEGLLILGCLGHSVPVLLDGSRLEGWMRPGGSPWGRHLAARWERLCSWGVHLLECGDPEGGTALVLSGLGWVTWRDLAEYDLDRVASVCLRHGTRLSPEARDRMLRRGIGIDED